MRRGNMFGLRGSEGMNGNTISFTFNLLRNRKRCEFHSQLMYANLFLCCVSLIFATWTFSSFCNATVLVTCESFNRSKLAQKCLNCDEKSWSEDSLRQSYKYILDRVPDCPVYLAELSGELVKSDYQFMQSAMKFGRWEDVPFAFRRKDGLSGYSLDSRGGDVEAALQLGDLLYTSRIQVNVQRCYSACVFVLAGAVRRNYTSTSDVGIHAPFPADVSGTKSYEDVIVAENEIYTKLESYMQKYAVSKAIVDRMRTVPSSQILRLDSSELYILGLGPKNARYDDEVRFEITRNCGNDLFEQYSDGEAQQSLEILKKCAPNLRRY